MMQARSPLKVVLFPETNYSCYHLQKCKVVVYSCFAGVLYIESTTLDSDQSSSETDDLAQPPLVSLEVLSHHVKYNLCQMEENTVIDDYLSSESDDQLSSERSSEYLNHLKVLLMFLTMWQFAFKISNSAITALLRFMRYFILSIGRAFSCDAIMDIAHSVPLTLSTVHKLISLENDHFVNFVVCPKCDSVYEFQDCIDMDNNGLQQAKDCSHIDFPNHPQASHRNPCGAKLLKQVRRKHGSSLVPIKVYPYMSLKESFGSLSRGRVFLLCVSNGGYELLHKGFYVIYTMEKCGKCLNRTLFLIFFLLLTVFFLALMLTGLSPLKGEFIVLVPFISQFKTFPVMSDTSLIV